MKKNNEMVTSDVKLPNVSKILLTNAVTITLQKDDELFYLGKKYDYEDVVEEIMKNEEKIIEFTQFTTYDGNRIWHNYFIPRERLSLVFVEKGEDVNETN